VSIFDGLENEGRQEKPKRERSLAFGACPHCSAEKVGLVRSPDGVHLVWKVHDFITHAGTRWPCSASGQRVCDHPARHIIGYDAPHCPHES
jgi:hypothetical protein